MKYLSLLLLLSCAPTYPTYYTPIENFVGEDGPWSEDQVTHVEWDHALEMHWFVINEKAYCVEYWGRWSWRKTKDGQEAVVTAITVKNFLKAHDSIEQVTQDEWEECFR